MSDEAKAVEEIAKTTGKAIDLTQNLGGFLAKVVGRASGQLGGVLEDWSRYFRIKNMLVIRDKVESLHKQRSLEGKTTPISLKMAIPMLEAASLEEENTLQDVWARLIANSIDPTFIDGVHPGYTEIIKQLTVDEAIILSALCDIQTYPLLFTCSDNITLTSGSGPSSFLSHLRVKEEALYSMICSAYLEWCKSVNLKKPSDGLKYLDNLQRLRIVEMGYEVNRPSKGISSLMARSLRQDDDNYSEPVSLKREEYLKITAFGDAFMKACINGI